MGKETPFRLIPQPVKSRSKAADNSVRCTRARLWISARNNSWEKSNRDPDGDVPVWEFCGLSRCPPLSLKRLGGLWGPRREVSQRRLSSALASWPGNAVLHAFSRSPPIAGRCVGSRISSDSRCRTGSRTGSGIGKSCGKSAGRLAAPATILKESMRAGVAGFSRSNSYPPPVVDLTGGRP